ncbi:MULTISPECIES: citrate/2-methylcitrate synthase [unclassified Streptomyces]|uniref:citrate/2-methylcitrate synthase n=1 Tax=unclassified Streptomyces TaxID=2593676 RepID=UPI000801014B|nr:MULTISPECIES: citrate/2-methylcitrate synthase [unclassified Streptomyces]MCP3771589.1 phosphopantetheine-binding protein [Streptomyces sp. MAR25Y5]OBQ52341.1 citrate (Si)-synthase [Streptomyces sp. H-KF8]
MSTVDQLVARTLGITEDRLTADLAYQSVREWDSLGHVALMVALEQEYGVEVDDNLMLELRTLGAVRAFAEGLSDTTTSTATAESTAPAPRTAAGDPDVPTPGGTVHRGLEGVTFDQSAVTLIDGAEGILEYRGYSIHDLAEHASFEEVAHLLVHGHLPGTAALEVFTKQLRAARTLPAPVLDLVRSLAHAHPMEALRTCVSALGAFGPRRAAGADESYAEAREAGIELIARIPMIVAAHHAFRSNREPLWPREDAGHAEAFLTVLLGEEPTTAAVRVIDKGFVVHADHGSNASAFTARVAIGCHADMTAALTAAIAAFSGSVHGGAAERVIGLVDEVGAPENAEARVAALRSRGEPVMGFGHRVYRTEDPRVRHLRASVVELSEERGDRTGLDILDAVAAAMRPWQRHGVAANVDLYAGLSYRLLGLPDDLAVALFVVGRAPGWVAQALEQHANNVLIRPLLAYAGPRGLTYPEGATR